MLWFNERRNTKMELKELQELYIQTERLILREMREDDFDALYSVLGDCGLTMQTIDGIIRPEIGYRIRADKQRKSYASEAAIAVRDWTFANTPFQEIYSYMTAENEAFARTAMSYGCQFFCEYVGTDSKRTKVYAVRKEDCK